MRPQTGAGKVFVVGFPCSTTIKLTSKDNEIRFTAPSGEKINAAFERNTDEAAVIFPQTREIGFYRILNGDQRMGSIAVNLDARESNLESLSMEQVQALSAISRDRFYAATGSDTESLRHLREGKPLWHLFLLGGICLLALEQFLSMLWRK
jgi:hypothetical protein